MTLIAFGLLAWPGPGGAHPLGNFSISQYTALRIGPGAVEVRYLVDMAEIPTFQEIQDAGIFAEPGHPSLQGWLPRKVETLKDGLVLEVDGRRLALRTEARDVIFPPGAGGLPTLKLGAVFRATLPPGGNRRELRYRDGNFPDRAGWKEVVAVAGPGVGLEHSSVPAVDRSRELADYPTDLLDSPPQDREARVVFTGAAPPAVAAARPRTAAPAPSGPAAPAGQEPLDAPAAEPSLPREPAETAEALRLEPNQRETPRSVFTDLVTAKDLGTGVVAVAFAVAAALGAFHALEPGHGKTVVAAYLIGSRGTAWHAILLGLIVTASHTAGVYVLGALTLYGSRYVVPERLYPWLGALSGLAIAIMGVTLLVRRYAEGTQAHSHAHPHPHGHLHAHAHDHSHDGDPDHHHHAGDPDARVSTASLVTLGVTGGIVPCPGALVVLLSAVSLNRIGFGLLLIVAFSIGLAAILIAIGILMVYARRFMARFQADGPLIQRWLPLTSSAVITVVGLVLAVQALVAGGVLQIRL